MKKQSFTMRLFSVLLCVAMLCTFAPLTTLAKMMEQVYVGGIEVTADNAADVLGDGTVSYDKYTHTLTIGETGIYDTYDTEEGSFGIYSNSDLNVVLTGSVYIDLYSADVKDAIAGIKANGDLNVTGDGYIMGKIPPAKDFAAGLVADGALTIDTVVNREAMMYGPVGFMTFDVSNAAESYAFVGSSINVVLGNAPYEMTAGTAVFSTAPTLTNFEFTGCEGGLVTPDDDDYRSLYGTDLLAKIEQVRYFGAFFSEFPDIEIGGVQLTMENKDDVLGDGTVYFDTDKWELVFDNANITGYSYDEEEDVVLGVVSHNYYDTNIRLVGDNVIDLRDAMDAMEKKPTGTIGLSNDEDSICLTGSGSLTVYAGDSQGFSYGVYSSDDLELHGSGDLTAYAGNADECSCGVYLSDDFYTYGSSDLTAVGGNTNYTSMGMYVDDAYLYGFGDCTFISGTAINSFGAYAWSFYLYGGKYEEDVDHGVRFIGNTTAFVGRDGTIPYRYIEEGDYTTLCAQTMSEDDLAAPDTETNSEETAKYVFLRSDSEKEYNIYVGDTQVTAKNAEDVLGDGTVSFNPSESAFVFNNANITSGTKMYGDQDFGGFYAEWGDLSIELIGENVIDLTEADVSGVQCICGMFSDCDLTFYGDGSLTILVPASTVEDGCSYGIYTHDDVWVYDTVAITVTTPDVENTYGFYCDDDCGIDSPNVSLTVGGSALYARNSVYNDSEFTAKYLTSNVYGGEVAENPDFCLDASVREACKTLKTAAGEGTGTGAVYDIYVGGRRVTSNNQDDVFGDGTVAYAYDYDRGVHTLTLNNADIDSYSCVNVDTAGIYSSYSEPLYIELVGDNTITVKDDLNAYVMGIFANRDIHFVGAGTLTVNVESNHNGYTYGINADYESYDVYFEADGEIAINMTGAAGEAKGIYAQKLYNKNNADVTITLSESYGTYGVYAYSTYLQSPANFTVSANFGEFENSPYAYGIYTYNLYDSPASGFVSVEGKTQAIYVGGSDYVNMLMLTAYEYADDEEPVENPAWYSLNYYEKVELDRAPHTVTPVLSATEAECSWWDDDKNETVGTDEDIEIGWNVGEEEISEVYLYYDRYNDGDYVLKATIDPKMESSYLLNSTFDYVLPGATLSWTVGAKFADGTVAFSEPFDLTFYKVHYDCELEIEVEAPVIGYTPNQITWYDHDYKESYKATPIVTWYKMNGETGTEMADDDIFMPGEQYAMIVEGTFEDEFRFDGETLEGTVVSTGNIAEDAVEYNDETNTLRFGALFAPLKDTIRYVVVEMAEPDATMTPADVSAAVKGYQVYTPIAMPMVDGKLNFSWTYCEGDTYVEANAVKMESTERFTSGNTYRGEISFKLKDRFTLADLTEYYLAPDGLIGPTVPLNGKYDDATGIVTVTLPDIVPSATVKELNMFVREPEAGQKPTDISAFGDELVRDYINAITIEWYEEDEEGTASDTPLASNEEFKAGVTYAMSMHVTLLDGDEFYDSMIPVTLNGQEPESSVVNYWDSAYIGQSFTIPETTTTIDALDFTVAAVKAGETPADVAVTFDTDKVSLVDVYTYVYEGTGDPNEDVDHYADMASTDVFEYGKVYAIEVYYALKAGLENGEEIAFTINGEEPFFAEPDGKKYGTVVMNFALDEPELTLSADATEFELGDEALKAVNFDVEYTFDATNRLLVDVVNADGDDVFCTALAAGTETFAVDMSGFEVGTYTVTVTAYDGANAIVSNSVDVLVKEKPTTEPTATATVTETEPTATGTEVILYGDANDDGLVNMKDVLILRKQLAGLMPIINMTNADCNGDGNVNMKDVLELRKYLAGLTTVLGPKA